MDTYERTVKNVEFVMVTGVKTKKGAREQAARLALKKLRNLNKKCTLNSQ